MESLKKPETIISLINTTALLGASVYFYRRINGLEQELDKNTEHLTSTIRKVTELQITKQHIKQLAAAIKDLNNAMGIQKNELLYLRSMTGFQSDQIKELQGLSKDAGSDVKLTQMPFQQFSSYQSPSGGQQSRQSALGGQQPMNLVNNYQQPNGGYQQPLGGQQPINQQPVNNQQNGNYQQSMNQQQQNGPYQQQLNQQPSGGYQQPGPYQQQLNQQQLNQQPSGGYQQPNGNSGYQQPTNYNNQQLNGSYQQPNGYQQPGSLIDLGGLDFGNQDQDDDDVDSQIDAVKRARQNPLGI